MATEKNPVNISWAHAVNSKGRLQKYLSDKSIDFIEGDVRCIREKVIMAHPPDTKSDLDFDEWIKLVVESSKGIKLDFKDQGGIEYCLKKLRDMDKKHPISTTVILNADILVGPGGLAPNVLKKSTQGDSMEPQEFVKLCKEIYPEGKLSVGWTTSNDATPYTREQVASMEQLVSNVNSSVTFPVRICKGPQSLDVLKVLIDYQHPGKRTLTWWNNEVLTEEERGFLLDLKENEPDFHFIDVIDPHTLDPLVL